MSNPETDALVEWGRTISATVRPIHVLAGRLAGGLEVIENAKEKRPVPEVVDFPAIRNVKPGKLPGVAKRIEMPPGQKTGPAYPPRAMRAEQSADYLSMSRSMFLKMVDEGKMPPPVKVGAMAMWDRYDIDHAFEDLKRGDGEPEPGQNTMHKLLGIKP
jgi:predicted DNA-binding transcriptional regulator AlpA